MKTLTLNRLSSAMLAVIMTLQPFEMGALGGGIHSAAASEVAESQDKKLMAVATGADTTATVEHANDVNALVASTPTPRANANGESVKEYDTLGRVTKETFTDGSYETSNYRNDFKNTVDHAFYDASGLFYETWRSDNTDPLILPSIIFTPPLVSGTSDRAVYYPVQAYTDSRGTAGRGTMLITALNQMLTTVKAKNFGDPFGDLFVTIDSWTATTGGGVKISVRAVDVLHHAADIVRSYEFDSDHKLKNYTEERRFGDANNTVDHYVYDASGLFYDVWRSDNSHSISIAQTVMLSSVVNNSSPYTYDLRTIYYDPPFMYNVIKNIPNRGALLSAAIKDTFSLFHKPLISHMRVQVKSVAISPGPGAILSIVVENDDESYRNLYQFDQFGRMAKRSNADGSSISFTYAGSNSQEASKVTYFTATGKKSFEVTRAHVAAALKDMAGVTSDEEINKLLLSGQNITQIRAAVLKRAERKDAIKAYYQSLLGRAATEAEINSWAAKNLPLTHIKAGIQVLARKKT